MATLVAGGAGFIGSFLCERLLQRGHTVICADNLITGRPANVSHLLGHPRFTVVKHNVTQPLAVDQPLERIYHLASPASPLAYQRHPIETMQANAEGTRLLLELARDHGARFLFASTSEIYGDPLEHPQRETYWGNTSCTGPRSMYDESKRYAEALTTSYRNALGLQTRIIRIFNTYGPRMALDDGRVVSNFIVQALGNDALTLYGDGSQTRSFQFIDDLIEGMSRLMESDFPDPVNIGNPTEFTMLELAQMVISLTGSLSPIEFRELPGDDPRRRCPDISLARDVLGWEPKVSLEQGLRKTIPHFQQQMGIAPVGHVQELQAAQPAG